MTGGDRPCREWYSDGCVLSAVRGELARVCATYERCLYAAPRSSFSADELEVLDAWSSGRVCLVAPALRSTVSQYLSRAV